MIPYLVLLGTLIYNKLGQALSLNGKYSEAKEQVENALKIYQKMGKDAPLRDKAQALTDMGVTLGNLEEISEALTHLETGLAIYKMIGDLGQAALTYSYIGRVLFGAGQKDEAREAYNKGLAIQEGVKRPYRRAILFAHLGLGIADLFSGNMEGAKTRFKLALRESIEINHTGGMIWSILEFGLAAGMQGKIDVAAQLIGFTEKARDETGNVFSPAMERGYKFLLAAFQSNINNDLLWTTLWESGQRMDFNTAMQVIADNFGEY